MTPDPIGVKGEHFDLCQYMNNYKKINNFLTKYSEIYTKDINLSLYVSNNPRERISLKSNPFGLDSENIKSHINLIGFYPNDINLYHYVNNNPLNYIDPMGLKKGWKYYVCISACGFAGSLTCGAICAGNLFVPWLTHVLCWGCITGFIFGCDYLCGKFEDPDSNKCPP